MSASRSPERRRVPRSPGSGRLKLQFENPVPAEVTAELIEVSSMGFRAAHDCASLDPGIEVTYQRDGGSGRARVIWTHVLDGRRMSGFLLL